MKGSKKSYSVQYPDEYITEHWHNAYRLQGCPEWILGVGVVGCFRIVHLYQQTHLFIPVHLTVIFYV